MQQKHELIATLLTEKGVGEGARVIVGLRAGNFDECVRHTVKVLGAEVFEVNPAQARSQEQQRLSKIEATHVIADSLLYLAAAKTPLRGYLQRRGFSVPNLRALAPVQIRVGRRLPLRVPRSSLLSKLANGGL